MLDNLSPDARAPVKYIDPISVQKENKEQENVTQINEQSELAYVMLRYRQTHDFLHTLTNVPITVRGELGIFSV